MSIWSSVGARMAWARSIFRSSRSRPYSQGRVSEEDPTRYCKGGYHAVRIGDLFHHERYKIVRKIGYGVYSTVWLAFDSKLDHHVAVKILTADTFGHGQDSFELDILHHMNNQGASSPGASHILRLLDQFEHKGPNGNHVCLVFPAMGPNMSHFRRLFPKLRVPMPMLKRMSRQLVLALSYLHDTCQVIHTDIKPGNILIETPAILDMFLSLPSDIFKPRTMPEDHYMRSANLIAPEEDIANSRDISVKLADFGTASWFDKHLSEWIQPQMLRAPEVTLGAQWDHRVDIWNLGLVIWELAEGSMLFDGQWTPTDKYTSEAYLAQVTAILGEIPSQLIRRSRHKDLYFNSEGHLLKPSSFPSLSLEKLVRNPLIHGQEKADFLELMNAMIRPDPSNRLDARELLRLSWLAEEGA